MAENFDLIFGQSAGSQYAWNDSDYQNGWQTVGDTPPTEEQFDALQRRSDMKSQELNNRLTPIETKSDSDTRQPSTAYSDGVMQTAVGLKYGWYLECTVGGTTSASALSIPNPLIENDTITDGTVVWTIRKIGDVDISGKADITGANMVYHRDVITTSGTYTAPVTGLYKLTVKGGGGGGEGGAHNNIGNFGGAGGGEGGTSIGYEKMTAGQTASVVIGAGGAGSATGIGSAGGDSSIVVNGNTYLGGGGGGGHSYGGNGGLGTIIGAPGVNTSRIPGQSYAAPGGSGGGAGGGVGGYNGTSATAGTNGGGGGGGGSTLSDGQSGSAGGDGYVWVEYYTPGA